jgi:hypothetical protein
MHAATGTSTIACWAMSVSSVSTSPTDSRCSFRSAGRESAAGVKLNT